MTFNVVQHYDITSGQAEMCTTWGPHPIVSLPTLYQVVSYWNIE
jgi:hypothetical protein